MNDIIGTRIRQYRAQLSMTQRELADKLGLTPKMVSFYENNERFPPYDILIKLSDIFGVSVDTILGREDKANTAAEYLRVMDRAKKEGITPGDLNKAMEFFADARKRDNE